MQHEGHPMPPIIFAPFLPTHTRIENFPSTCRPIICGKNKNGIFIDPKVFEQIPRLAHIFIDIGNHPIKCLNGRALSLVQIHVFLRTMERPMRGIGGDVSQEWLSTLR